MKPLLKNYQKNLVLRILTHALFISSVLGILTFVLLKINPNPYTAEIESTSVLSYWDRITSYGNLDRDSGMEKFGFANSRGGNCNILVFDHGLGVKDQWNFKGTLNFQSTGNHIGDYDHDGLAELVCISTEGRNIYLNLVEPFDSISHPVDDVLIDTIWASELNPSIMVPNLHFYDLNGDGFDEVVFSLNPWYALQPRRIYAWDIRHGTLMKSPIAGFSSGEFIIVDYDRDLKPEIFATSNASNNYVKGGIAYPDTAGYFFVLDNQLQYRVSPKIISGVFSNLLTFLIRDGQDSLVWYIMNNPNDSLNPIEYWSVNRDLSLVKENHLPGMEGNPVGCVEVYHSKHMSLLFDVEFHKLYLFSSRGYEKTVTLSATGRFVPVHNPEVGLHACEFVTQINGRRNFIDFWSASGRRLTRLELEPPIEFFDMDWIGPGENGNRFLITSESVEYEGRIFRNPFYYLKYLILILLIAGFYGFIYLIRAIQKAQLAAQESMRREILELQLKSVRNQLDPHFTFNALNTLSGLSLTGDQKGVDHFIGHFSRLLRTHLQTADKIMIPLRDEIEFVVNYVELQRIRFDDLFELVLEIPASIDLSIQVPRMMIQTHVENAIKHGLAPGQEGRRAERQEGKKAERQEGKIWVRVKEEETGLRVEIEDNGSGRGKGVSKPHESTGKGLVNQERIFKSLWQLYGIRIQREIIDLYLPDGSPGGMRVEIFMKDAT